ncbi:MAG: DNA polymerase [Phycisphaeraceae bacterium]
MLDLETYFDKNYSLKKISTPEYVHDARFHVHGLAVRYPNGKAEFKTDVPGALKELQEQYGQDLEQATVVCHNAAFDLYVLNHCYGIRPKQFVDTMLLSHHVHGRKENGKGAKASLEALAERYGLKPKGDLDFMEGVRYPDAKQQAELADYATTDVAITYQLLVKLLPQVTRLDVEVPLMMHTVRLFTERGVHVDVEGIQRIRDQILAETQDLLARAGITEETASGDKLFSELLEHRLARTGRHVPRKQGKNGPIPATAKNDEAMLALLEDEDPLVQALVKARVAKKSQDQKLSRLNTLEGIANATGGVLPMQLIYYGAHTGRFSGRGFNVQNMDRSGYGLKIRQLLVPARGNTFVIADLAQIEARVTAWSAGQTDMLEAFAQGRDIYSEFATEVFGEEVRKTRDGDSSEFAQWLTARRQVGKQAVLGLGFGMGALKFRDTLKRDKKTAALFESGQITDADCKRIVDTFRERYSSIKTYWGTLEEAANQAVHGGVWAVNGSSFQVKGKSLHLTLPSGRDLRYANPRFEWNSRTITYLDRDGYEAEFSPPGDSLVYGEGKDSTGLYGGIIAENIVQSTARDILAEAILAIERAGFPVMFHVHDEVIVEVPKDQAEQALGTVTRILQQTPAWAHGLPIACEANIADRYGK